VDLIDIKSLLSESTLPGAMGHRALGRLIRLIDDGNPLSDEIDENVKSSAFRAARIGLTGPPGCGKSSLIASSLEHLSAGGKKIGILAVDPTSPFTGGAVLGDRVRLKGQTTDNVFFRSLASRGSLGGVSRAIWPASRLLDWWGADIILIETVGSGQLGTGVADVADLVVAILTPEAGDGIQSMKAGVMELADCFVVNKCDRPGSDLVLKELNLVKEEAEMSGRPVEVFPASAINEEGIVEAIEGIRSLWNRLNEKGEIKKRRFLQARRELSRRIEEEIYKKITLSLGGEKAFETALNDWTEKILSGESTPSEATKKIIL
jgi:LAO/AO transport system kinase